MKKFLLLSLLLLTTSINATLYTPGSGGGGGAVDSVNGYTGVVDLIAEDVLAAALGGNTHGAVVTIGTKDNFGFTIRTNDTDRLFISASGAVTAGGDTSGFTSVPKVFGSYLFQTTDDALAYNVFDNFFSYYGSSGNSKDGTLYRLSLRPGETGFTYSGDYNALRADGYVSQPGVVNSFNALKLSIVSANSDARINDATSEELNVVNAGGIIRMGVGSRASVIEATGTDNSAHLAIGYDVASAGGHIIASGSSVSNTAVGIRINDNISASDTSPLAYAIQSLSTQPSTFAGLVSVGSLRINTAPSASAATASTHKVQVNINGVTYYLLLTNVP